MTLLKEKKEFQLKSIIEIFRYILLALTQCNAAKVIHRDLKPQNIIINLNTLKPKLIDFGLSLLIDHTT
jgi:serine/threonine protein kinase